MADSSTATTPSSMETFVLSGKTSRTCKQGSRALHTGKGDRTVLKLVRVVVQIHTGPGCGTSPYRPMHRGLPGVCRLLVRPNLYGEGKLRHCMSSPCKHHINVSSTVTHMLVVTGRGYHKDT